jgi:hypothetical protein
LRLSNVLAISLSRLVLSWIENGGVAEGGDEVQNQESAKPIGLDHALSQHRHPQKPAPKTTLFAA